MSIFAAPSRDLGRTTIAEEAALETPHRRKHIRRIVIARRARFIRFGWYESLRLPADRHLSRSPGRAADPAQPPMHPDLSRAGDRHAPHRNLARRDRQCGDA